ncbi:hypothetical protein OAJ78_05445 [Gammaproteobacteria bacterium]|nr:hypothetical protein [Gammaproteobacteria bacterium]
MAIGSKFRGGSNSSNDDLYEKAWAELEAKDIQQGLWARLWAENDGDETKTKAAYLKERVKQLQESSKTEEAPASSPSTSQSSPPSSSPPTPATLTGKPTRSEYARTPLYIVAFLGWMVVSAIASTFLIKIAQAINAPPIPHYFVLVPIGGVIVLGLAIGYFSLFKSLNKMRFVWVFVILGVLGVIMNIGMHHSKVVDLADKGLISDSYANQLTQMSIVGNVIAVIIFVVGYRAYWRRKYRLNTPNDGVSRQPTSQPPPPSKYQTPASSRTSSLTPEERSRIWVKASNTKSTTENAIADLLPRAEAGDTVAQFKVGMLLRKIGREEEAAKWMKKSTASKE